ncbi:NAD(P)-dependent oxidoreductase [Ciceribacter sp. RN22]|uniref:NAD-dependent epimerase/dehydratase family protein n=1 Tax=Ciceribacter sp. RN22 TaxID=2954932 RepID=UPI002093A25E|nr:NAD(P)-dependent oxidoreductase [Ciceribacter sp. RN22]MCO6179500.1 NAD(P)-dependent oxidoreductase [Ciceribacter sp. RN22]
MHRLLITGAAGGIGRIMRQRLAPLATIVRLSDICDLGEAAPNEELVSCDLGDDKGVHDLVKGCDAIVHLGGMSGEASFAKIMNANIAGCYNLYEAARANGMPRILLASSLHTVGFYRQDEYFDANVPLRPDGLYGVSKCFSEALARMYFDKFGQETAVVRIGSCFEHPRDHRMLASWLSYGDFASLAECVFKAPRLGCPVIWGVSNNDARWWDNSRANFLGWQPRDNAGLHRARIEETVPLPDPQSSSALYQGGPFTEHPIFKED